MSKEGDWLVHHGVSGQKWGVRNGPPYPLTGAGKARSRKQSEQARKNKSAESAASTVGSVKSKAVIGSLLVADMIAGALTMGLLQPSAIISASATLRQRKKAAEEKTRELLEGKANLQKKDKEFSEKADIKAINPKYTGIGGGYSNNCSNCTMAYELRKRGFDVTAKPLFGGRAVDTVREVFGNPKERTPDLSNVKTGFGSTKQYVNAVKADIGKNMPDGARGGIYLAFNGGGSGHIFNWTKSGGQVSFVDAQDSGRNADKNFNNSVRDSVRYFRTDNAKINMSLLNEQVTNRKR